MGANIMCITIVWRTEPDEHCYCRHTGANKSHRGAAILEAPHLVADCCESTLLFRKAPGACTRVVLHRWHTVSVVQLHLSLRVCYLSRAVANCHRCASASLSSHTLDFAARIDSGPNQNKLPLEYNFRWVWSFPGLLVAIGSSLRRTKPPIVIPSP